MEEFFDKQEILGCPYCESQNLRVIKYVENNKKLGIKIECDNCYKTYWEIYNFSHYENRAGDKI